MIAPSPSAAVARMAASWRAPQLQPFGDSLRNARGWSPAPAAAAAFLREGYPGMAGVDDNFARAQAAGFEPIDHFTLPPAALVGRVLRAARAAHGAPAAAATLAAAIDETRREIELFRSYGYGFYLLRRRH